jgi:excisionase family DNA binding protein
VKRFDMSRAVTLAALAAVGAPWAASTGAVAASVSQHEVLDLDEAAALLRVNPATVRAMAETQRLPARRVGDAWRFSRAAVLDWLKGEPAAGVPGAAPATGAMSPGLLSSRELTATTARGAMPEVLPRLAQLDAAAKPAPSGPQAPPPTIGERPTIRSAEEIALRDQRVLLRPRAATLDVGVSYSHSEQTLFPVVREEQRTVGASATVRYGLREDLQLTLRVPGVWRRTATYADATITGTTAPRITHDNYVADAAVSLLGVAMREAAGRPNVIWSLDGVVPTGAGDRGVGAGTVIAKSFDPAVIFAGFSYLHGLSVEPGDSRRSLAKHNLGASLGYTYALNDSLALNSLFVATYRTSRTPDGISIPPSRERYQLQLGMTWMLAPGLFMEPAVAMRIGGPNPDLTFSLNVPYSF